jgi:hypothetical protein
MSEQTKQQHKDGPPWDSVRTFSTFEEAQVFRDTCQKHKELQVKVKKYVNNIGESVFVVKTRRDPSFITEAVKEKKKDKNKK